MTTTLMLAAPLLAAPLSPTPRPSGTTEVTPSQAAAPGVWAFVAFLFLAIALWLLMRNMNARLRRMSYRQKAAERDAAPAGGLDGSGDDIGSDPVVERDGRGDVVGDEREDR